jgi:glycerol kinase
MGKYILAIDQGTTGTTSLLINASDFSFVAKVTKEYKQHYPKPSWVEHYLPDIWRTIGETISELLKNNDISANDIESIGITNQRETTCAYDKDGNPLAMAIVWQDRRTHDFCVEKKDDFEIYKKVTGLPLDPYFSATKMRWLLENNNDVKEAAANNNLRLSTIDSFLLYKLSGCQVFYTEPTNASRTNLMGLESCQWDDRLINFFGLKKDFLPEIKETFTHFGETKGLDFLPDGIPITCLIGDQQSALFGQTCTDKGELKCTYGTGAFLLLNTGNDIIHSKNGLLTTLAYSYKGKNYYALEGSCYIAGAAVQWLRDNLDFFSDSGEIENYAHKIENMDEMEHVMFLPFFTGMGSPYWNSQAKASIVGLTRDTNKYHISRACLDGIALSINDLITAFENDGGFDINNIKVDGGAANNNLLMQIQSNFLQKTIYRPMNVETTSMGAAFGSALGNEKINITEIRKFWSLDKEFIHESDLNYFEKKKKQWAQYVQKVYLANF